MKVTSVKVLADTVSAKWQTGSVDGDVTKHERTSNAGPTPELANAVSDLKADVADIMDFPAKWMETVTATGITVNYEDDGTAVVSYAYKKKLKSGLVVGMSTAGMRQRTDHSQKGSSFLTDDQWERVSAVLVAARRWVEGERAQTSH